MTPSEKIAAIQMNKEKCYLHITPNLISVGAHLADNYDTLDLYCDMEENTLRFAEKKIVNLISAANYIKREMTKEIQLSLVICSDDVDMLEYAKDPVSYILNKSDKIVAIYKYVKSEVMFEYADNRYGYLYLNFSELIKEFNKYDIKCEFVTSTVDSKTIDFMINYQPKDFENKNRKSKVKKRVIYK